MNRSLTLLPAALLVLASCGGGDDDPDTLTGADETRSGESAAPPSAGSDAGSESEQAEPAPRTPIEVADDLASQIDAITKTTKITEDNDPNDLLGRPGGYIAAAVIEDDRRVGGAGPVPLPVVGPGAKRERS